MDILISNASARPIYEQIEMQIKNAIISGALQAGDALPSMRLLAKELQISVITTKRAYEELERDGFIVTVAGKGCFVAYYNTACIKEEQCKRIEEALKEAITLAKTSGVTLNELQETLQILFRGESL
ncbi:MAG: GntR family transcriptional regulator [Oscillospiraceae bacterium]|nr:GntR family transcriptional regulator [Oscillospiraceae bacterium]